MKFDMHCHTKAGSIDAKIPLEQSIRLLKSQEFDGMLVTDHDSYRGIRQWKEQQQNSGSHEKNDDAFVVLEGIEYDTKDAGHFLVIMPDHVYLEVLQLRGMSVKTLIEVVHGCGGILGPAHPFGTRASSAMFYKKIRQNPEIFQEFDFIEGFNSCESKEANRIAGKIANYYQKPSIGGSDAHEEAYVGMAFTEIQGSIRSNNDLIAAIHEQRVTACGGTVRTATAKSRHKEAFYSVWGFKFYNRSLGLLFTPLRKHHIKKMSLCPSP
ncbi:MAG: PHP domain-containing protein [Firmicutes bacterium]|nr:PHP domain-containing protein [Bacillota bacterium]